ncbi:ATP-binding protein [Nocardioides currus]|uniref:histidine kinase n=1 Tax=Nocardioides currus TaxID=2133958 RepID=A0A2R7YT54_9ACTN|nr:ATP-binding protein [Nocardioides currus]PUA79578.1 hypothetical protein C7S10_17780 [Nocardioides currus]
MALHRRQAAGLLLVLATSYLAVVTSPGGARVSEWWLASGIAACVMVVSPRRHIPALVVLAAAATWAGNVLGGRDPVTGPWLGLANAIEAGVIAMLLTHGWRRPAGIHTWTDLRRYFLVVALGSSVPALVSAALSFGVVDRSASVVAAWVFINHLGCNLVLLLLVLERPAPSLSPSALELVVHLGVLVAALALTYAPNNVQSVAFLLTPVAVWAGARFPSRWAVLELLVLGAAINVFARLGLGPFEVHTLDSSLVSVLAGLQSFMATNVLIALVISTGVALERERGLAMVAQQREVEEATSAALAREREANVQMQAMDRAKNELISTISHELRTPLTSIVGYVELLEDGDDLPEARRADLLARVSRNADRLLTLARDVLRIAALDQDEWAPRRQLIDLRACVQAAQDTAAIPAARHGELTVGVEVPDHPVEVHADQQEIERVVVNFVSNAIKFTPGRGSICIRLATRGDTARISVEDSGLGIARPEQDRIFERFFRSSIAREHAVPGTGLGLSIARSIAEAHDGSVGFWSREGEGSTFWVDLPMAGDSEPALLDQP